MHPDSLPESSRMVAKKRRKIQEQSRKVEDPPNHLLRVVKFLEFQQSGTHMAKAREDQAGEELLWELQCFGKHRP